MSKNADITPAQAERKHQGRRHRGVFITLAVVLLAAVALANVLVVRSVQANAGVGIVSSPELRPVSDSSQRTGAFTAEVSYPVTGKESVTAHTQVAWDDAWFFGDPTAYNHELATTCSVLSELAYAESTYYQVEKNEDAYMEDALAELGFTQVSTTSYQYRSKIIDEILAFVTGKGDVVAYTVASKKVSDGAGHEKTLFLVSVRGSYGAEWISDAYMGSGKGAERKHRGFELAADGVLDELQALAEQEGVDGQDVALLFCGHSRGAAIANLAAARADEAAGTSDAVAGADADDVWAYTYATPMVTTAAEAHDSTYDNIFNVTNPSDFVPTVPFACWGYQRYGRDVSLPRVGTQAFDAHYEDMRQAYAANCGTEPSGYRPEDAEAVERFVRHVEDEVPTRKELFTLTGAKSLVVRLLTDMNVVKVLQSHAPDVYTAWLQATDAEDLGM